MRGMLALAAMVALCVLGVQPAAAQDYDVVLRNGKILDGEGNPWYRGDIGIKAGRIAKIGRVAGRGAREIDVNGRFVSPGFIDVMDYSGGTLLKNGLADNKVRQGVTTAIAGEHGSEVPSAQLSDYFRRLERSGISLNFGTYYGAGQARIEVMGDVAGTPTPAQMDRMKAHVEEAMRAGAMGIGTALIYPPYSFQTTGDLIELAKVAARHNGLFAVHMRDESAKLLEAVNEVIEITEKSGITTEIFHLKGAYAPGWGKLVPQAIKLIDDARGRGVDIAGDMYLYTAGGTGISITAPNWIFADGYEKGIARLKDPEIRKRLKREIEQGSQPGWSNLYEAAGGWDRIWIANAYNPDYDRYRNRSIADVAKELGKDPADLAWDIATSGKGPYMPLALFFMMDEKDIETLVKVPWVSIGSDAGANTGPGTIDAAGLPHPRAHGNFPRLIAEYVKRRNVITLPDAIRKMTSWPAARMRLYDRGAIREGLRADLTVFDYERIDDRASYEKPSEAPTGIDYVLVNGQIVVEDGHHTGRKPGSVIRGQGYTGN